MTALEQTPESLSLCHRLLGYEERSAIASGCTNVALAIRLLGWLKHVKLFFCIFRTAERNDYSRLADL